MLRLTYSNRTEALLGALAERLPRDPFVESQVIVPNRAMERVVELGLAHRTGCVANIRFERLETWLARLLEADPAQPFEPRVRLLDGDELEGRLLSVLLDVGIFDDPELAPVAKYLAGSGGRSRPAAVDRRRIELASRLAALFQEYTYSRPEWIRAWMGGHEEGPEGPTAAWQGALYRRARAIVPIGADGVADRVPRTTLAELLAQPSAWAQHDDVPVHVFGVSYVAPAFHHALARVAKRRDVIVYALNPCREFWADVETVGEARARARRARGSQDDPLGLLTANESTLLRAWGRPGREHVALLDEASGFDADARFVEPVGSTTLARVQASILERAPVAPGVCDGSLVVLPCTSVRREVETVAQLVWGLIADAEARGRPVRLSEIAILVQASARETYLPHFEAVFGEPWSEEAHHLPWSAQDLQLAGRSRVAEAALRLLAFFAALPTRRELLGLVAHPMVAHDGSGERREIDPAVWAELAEAAGIVRGIDASDLEGTYADRASGEGEVLHFEQGLARLALGCALGEATFRDEGRTPVRPGGHADEARAFLVLVRSLLADHRAIGGARLPLRRWGEVLAAVVSAYVLPSTRAEEAELERCTGALRGLASLDVDARPVGRDVALPLATRALEAIPAVRGEPQALGLVVASLLPMRAIPFRFVFVLGLGEGMFPQQRADLGLDLRVGRRRSGDVSPEERDRYAFLETLLSTRERLFLSWVARDEHTGDPIAPSSVVTELDEACGGLLRCAPPHRRYEAVELGWIEGLDLEGAGVRAVMTRALPVALLERGARARGDGEREVFRAFELASEAFAQLAPEDPRRLELVLPPLGPPPPAEQETATVRIDVLRQFLRCPIQGWARHWLRQEQDAEKARFVADEPLDAEDGRVGPLGRAAFLVALEGGLGGEPFRALRGSIEAALRDARGRGQLPVGVLGERAARTVAEAAERRLGALLEARPGAREARAVRFGSVSSAQAARESRVHALAAVELCAAGQAFVLEGRTRPLLVEDDAGDPNAGDVLVLVEDGERRPDRARVARLRGALDAYVDHVVIAASGRDMIARRAVLLGSGEPWEVVMAPIRRDVAARWLGALVQDLLQGEPRFLPVEAVLLEEDAMRRGDPKLGERLARAVEIVRTKWEGGSSRWGPIREAIRYDAPELRELVRVVARRFSPFFQHVRTSVRSARGQDAEGLLR
ncbi:MAG: hypothetical protein OHK0013_30210 [Sandaracinaceae bacterium]